MEQKGIKLKDVKAGEWFTRKPYEHPTDKQVFIRGKYDQTTKKYMCTYWYDISRSILLKGDTIVYLDFEF